jgi:hypothetical protein
MSEVASSNLDADVLVRQTVDWDQYAHCYDLLCSLNPAYLELLREPEISFVSVCRKPWPVPVT